MVRDKVLRWMSAAWLFIVIGMGMVLTADVPFASAVRRRGSRHVLRVDDRLVGSRIGDRGVTRPKAHP